MSALLFALLAFTFLPYQSIAQSYSGPIVISKGGTYSGNWESRDSNVSAVEVTTSEPVIIENSNIRGAGRMIRSAGHGAANITVRNTNAYGLAPTPWHDYKRTRYFVAVDEFTNIVVENCYIEGAAGINLGGRYLGNGTTSQTIRIRYNKVKNIDGRIYGGVAGVCFVGLNFRNPVKNAEIAWNQVINEPGNSIVEDNINLSNSRGTSDSPIRIHDNYIQGAYPLNPKSGTYSGGGIITDSWYHAGMGTPSDVATAHVKIYNNQTVNMSNYNYSIAGGNNIEIYNNRAVTSALLPDGTPVNTHNIGLTGYDYYNLGATHSNAVHNNLIGVMGIYANELNTNSYFPDGTAVRNYNNTHMSGRVTKQHEQDEFAMWQNKLNQNGIVVGPHGSAPANAAPTVAITSPVANASYTESSMKVAVAANDTDGSVNKVELYLGGTKVGEQTLSPYGFTLSNLNVGSHTLTAKAIDNSGAVTTSQAIKINITESTDAPQTGDGSNTSGSITREVWTNLNISSLSQLPLSKTPNNVTSLSSFEAPTNTGDHYGQRIRGYVTAPVSGQYTFWIAGDDDAALYLSTSESAADKKQIAHVDGYTSPREWGKYASQQSVKVTLEAGKRYYIEALHLEMGGGDNLAVGWQLPNGTKEMPIAGGRLSPIGSTAPAAITQLSAATGSITREFWADVHVSTAGAIPFTQSPDNISELKLFEAPTNADDHYGQRIRGYVTAPQSGEYTFWIAGDDEAELYLSTSDNPGGKQKIAYITGLNNWTAPREWNKFATQKSVKVTLKAGQRYYIEALHLEHGGGDNLAVGWQLPDGAMERPIAGSRLSPISNSLTSTSNLQVSSASEKEPFFSEATAYPNPFSEVITLSLGSQETKLKEVVLLDQTGRVVYKQEDLTLDNNKLAISLSGAGLASGLYILKYTDATGSTKSLKVIKQ
ncbi:hypothetical protein GCM10023188_21100 [Pontibacter saemangeumensis]|uniref:PA14 domain-containing protein n=1 Tax=Pontibacter saemangeumensis TaxID=1084525 RepID=A0ABP8LME5_9BACT